MIDKDELTNLASEDLKQALDELWKIMTRQNVKTKECIMLKARLREIEKDRRNAIINDELYYIAKNKVMSGCLDLIEELSDVANENDEPHENFPSKDIKNDNPRLEIEILSKGKLKSPLAFSPNNEVDENGAISIRQAIYINKITWRFNIIIRNNSIRPAFYPELELLKGKFHQLDKLNRNKPIKPFEEAVLYAEYSINLEAKGKDAVNYMNARYFPDELNDLIILLNYENGNSKKITNKFQVIEGNGHNEIIK